MSARAVALLCLATLAHAASYRVQKIPQFYTSSDCSGPIDPASKQWGLPAVKGGMVYPFAWEGAWLDGWAFDTCIAGNTTAYGMMLKIDETACSGNNAANQLQLLYYAGDGSCKVTPTVVPLTLNTCVAYPLGSVKLTPQLSTDDLCTATDYIAKMMVGGMTTEVWKGSGCSGTPVAATTARMGKRLCANEPECDGCCMAFDDDTCTANPTSYSFNKVACTKNGNTWRFALAPRDYSDSWCTKEVSSMFSGKVVEMGRCIAVGAKGQTMSMRITFAAPMTGDVNCEFVDMALRNKLSADVVSWTELNGVNGAAGAVPQVLLLALLVAAFLL